MWRFEDIWNLDMWRFEGMIWFKWFLVFGINEDMKVWEMGPDLIFLSVSLFYFLPLTEQVKTSWSNYLQYSDDHASSSEQSSWYLPDLRWLAVFWQGITHQSSLLPSSSVLIICKYHEISRSLKSTTGQPSRLFSDPGWPALFWDGLARGSKHRKPGGIFFLRSPHINSIWLPLGFFLQTPWMAAPEETPCLLWLIISLVYRK